jgi:hypothetical protein
MPLGPGTKQNAVRQMCPADIFWILRQESQYLTGPHKHQCGAKCSSTTFGGAVQIPFSLPSTGSVGGVELIIVSGPSRGDREKTGDRSHRTQVRTNPQKSVDAGNSLLTSLAIMLAPALLTLLRRLLMTGQWNVSPASCALSDTLSGRSSKSLPAGAVSVEILKFFSISTMLLVAAIWSSTSA